MEIRIDSRRRMACMRAHTATHLLHAQLSRLLPDTKQAGSLVDEDYLRFDFLADQFLSPAQLQDIEHNINKLIAQSYTVDTQIMSKEEALQGGAKAFFQDKYGDQVRVVSIRSTDGQSHLISQELCGGTHVARTDHIGIFKIISQQAVASGTKRIIAYTGPKVYEYIVELEKDLAGLALVLDCNTKQVQEKLQKFIKEYDHMQDLQNNILDRYVSIVLGSARHSPLTIQSTAVVLLPYETLFAPLAMSLLGSKVLGHLQSGESVLCYDQDGTYVLLNKDQKAKMIAQAWGLKGGGHDQMIQGKDIKILEYVR